jgi:hypothetical protein
VGPDHNWCSACGRSDNDACARCEELRVELGHARRFLDAEKDQVTRMGTLNRELQQLLGVQYPGGIKERALEIIAERDKLLQLVREYFAARAELDSWGPARNLRVKGIVRTQARAKAQRRFDAADDALRAAVGVDNFGNVKEAP